MAYALERFGSVTLPIYNPETDISPAPADGQIMATAGGAFDGDGTGAATIRYPHELQYTAIVAGDTNAAWRTAVDQIRALVGTRAALYRRAQDDDSVQWCTARLTSVQMRRKTRDRVWMEARLQFAQLAGWRGTNHDAGWLLDAGEIVDGGLYLDSADFTATMGSSPHVLTVTNAGNRTVIDPLIRVTAGSAPITALTVTASGVQWTYSGTIASGQVLVVDCADYSVKNNGTNDYAHFALGGSHTQAAWMELAPGNTAVTLTFTGGGATSTVAVEFSDGWA